MCNAALDMKSRSASGAIRETPEVWDETRHVTDSRTIHGVFDESEVFRIDHLLGKETVQNLLALRFGSSSTGRSGTVRTSRTCRSTFPRRSPVGTRAG